MKQELELVAVGALRHHPENARRGNAKVVRESIRENGWYGAIIVQRSTGFVLVGNTRLDAAIAEGRREIPVIYADVDDARARRIMLADNRTSDLAEYEDESLAELLRKISAEEAGFAGTGFAGTGFDDAALAELLERTGPTLIADDDAPDEEPSEPPSEPITKPGDVWALGSHRLICADSTQPDLVRSFVDPASVACVVEDPPYAIYGSSTGIASDICDDKMIRPFFRSVLAVASLILRPFGHVYVFCDWRSWSSWWEVSRGLGIVPKNMIVWDKGGGLGAMYANCHELIFFGAQRPMRKRMTQKITGDRQVFGSNIWKINRAVNEDGDGRKHNAQKPVALFVRALSGSSDKGDLVADLFLGSGTMLLAAEELERRAIGFEVDPGWCDVAIERWERKSGGKAKRA